VRTVVQSDSLEREKKVLHFAGPAVYCSFNLHSAAPKAGRDDRQDSITGAAGSSAFASDTASAGEAASAGSAACGASSF
jgi:hypothetical protein